MKTLLAILLLTALAGSASAQMFDHRVCTTQCYGSGNQQVCTTTCR